MKLENTISGVIGKYLRHQQGRDSMLIVVRTMDGREYFAPENEWIKLHTPVEDFNKMMRDNDYLESPIGLKLKYRRYYNDECICWSIKIT